MKLLFFKWNSFLNEGIEQALKNLEIDYTTFFYQFTDWEDDDDFLELFRSALSTSGADQVLSVNYSPLIAKICNEFDKKYVAYIYDSPIHIRRREELFFSTTHLFCFDRGQAIKYRNEGIKAWHQPLAASPKLFLREVPSAAQRRKYASEISFVGQLYETDYRHYCGPLDAYRRGFLEGVIKAQGKVYGAYFLPELITDDLLEGMNECYLRASNGKVTISRPELEYMLACEVTSRERYIALALLSNHFQVKHYAAKKDERLSKVEYMGYADYRKEMPKVFQLSRINLNITLKTIQTGIPLRALDVMACGGFLISNYQEELAEYFRLGEEVVTYGDLEELVYLADHFLQDEDARRRIALAGQQRVEEAFSYEEALKRILYEA